MSKMMMTAGMLLALAACAGEDVLETELARSAAGERFFPPEAPVWGGGDSGAWSPEAVAANGASRALNAAWAGEGVADVVVAVPMQIQDSDFHPYGDGQSNSGADFVWWTQPRPPVVATLVSLRDGSQRIDLHLDRELPWGGGAVHLELEGLGRVSPVAQRTREGDWRATWTVAGVSVAGLRIVPEGWAHSFPVHFEHPAHPVDDVIAQMPVADQDFGGGRWLPDPAGLSGASPFRHDFGAGYNDAPFEAAHVHSRFPGRAQQETAVGGSWAWVAQPPAVPFKHVYLCTPGRLPAREAEIGSPSGAGWHKIGDPAEYLVNSVERGPVLAGWSAADGGEPAAYDLREVATYRWLRPDEALVSLKGEYHWYAFVEQAVSCTEIWVRPADDATVVFEAHVETAWGESVWMVGAAPELGAWDLSLAVPMDPSDYPIWRAGVELDAQGTEFKLVKADAQGNVTWQDGPNRVLLPGAREWAGVW
jgi:hypothetical protein